MNLTVDDLVKIILVLSVSFSLVGLAIQIMRLLSSLNETVKESNVIISLSSRLLEKVSLDYDYIIEQLKLILESVSGFTRGVFQPLTKLFSFLKKFTDRK